MNGRSTLLIATIAAGLVFLLAGPAHATPPPPKLKCETVGALLVCTIVDEEPGDSIPPQPGPVSPYRYEYTPGIGPCPGLDERLWVIDVYLIETGELVRSYSDCLGPGDPPTPTPPPPTQTEVAQAIEPLLQLDTSLSPPPDGIGGISQVDTWFWCDNDGDVAIDLTLNEWNTTATVRVARLVWTVVGPDGTIDITTDDCGTEPDPYGDGREAAGHWTPNLPGDYTVTLTAEWTGTWTRTRGAASQTFALEPVSIAGEPLAYTVIEIQTVGTTNRP